MTPTATLMAGGVTGVSGVSQDSRFIVGGTWAIGDTINLVFTDAVTGVQQFVGAGELTGQQPTFCFTYKNREYLLAGTKWLFSAIDAPTVFNDVNALGNGVIELSDFFDAPEIAVSMANYQGNMAVLAQDNIQIWQVDPDPTLFKQLQVLENIGTFAAESTQALGDLDVLFLHYTGIRSLRVRDSSNNAFVVDVGSAIDALIQAKLITCSGTEKAAACGIVEPSSNRYWLFLKDTVYVLSYFPTNKIVAWATYAPTYDASGTQTAFTPQKFIIYNGQVYCRASDAAYVYGGSDNNTYDACVCEWDTSYLDFKQPGRMKQTESMGFACSGAWDVSVSADPKSGTLEKVYSNNGASYDIGSATKQTYGSHIKWQGKTTGSTAAVFSSLNMQYKLADKR